MATIPTPAELQYQRAHINDNLVPSLLASNIVCLTLATVAVALRFVCRWVSNIKYQYDDWLIVAGLVFTTAVITCQFIGIRYGAGRHTIVYTTSTTSDKGFTRTLLAVEVIYQAATFCIKASILYLYHRVFFVSRRFTIVLCAVAIFILLYGGVQGLGSLIECVPTNAQWDPLVKRHCFPVSAAVTVFAICNVLTDFVILILPMPLLWGLHQPLEQRVKLMGMFALGGFVCFASIYRAVIIHNLSRKDPSYDDIPSQVWTAIEMGMGVVSVCLPTYRPIFSLIIPRLRSRFGYSDKTSPAAAAAGEMEHSSNPSDENVHCANPELALKRERSKPSQSSEFAHIGVLGREMERGRGAKGSTETAVDRI